MAVRWKISECWVLCPEKIMISGAHWSPQTSYRTTCITKMPMGDMIMLVSIAHKQAISNTLWTHYSLVYVWQWLMWLGIKLCSIQRCLFFSVHSIFSLRWKSSACPEMISQWNSWIVATLWPAVSWWQRKAVQPNIIHLLTKVPSFHM